MQANSAATSPGARPREGRAAAVGDQQHGDQGGVGPPLRRTIPLAEAGKGTADDDGFIEVRSAGRTREGQGEHTGDRGQGAAAGGGANSPQRPATQEVGGGGPEGPQTQGGSDDNDGDQQHENVQAPTEEDLRGFWEAAKEVLAYARKQGYSEEHPVRRNAQRQVDEALAEWRAATPPKALHTRMGWAEEALLRARRAQAKAEQELDDLDRQYEADREQKVQNLCDARQRTRERTQKLADLSKEAAEEYHGEVKGDDAQVLKGAFRALDSEVGPAVEAALGKMEQGTEQYSILHQALQTIASLHGVLGAAAGGSAADYFDMAVDDINGDPPAEPGTRPQAPTEDQPSAMDTTGVRVPRWMEPKRGGELDPVSSTGAQPPRWKKNRAYENGSDPPKAHGAGDAHSAASSGGLAAAAPTAQQDEFAPRRAQIITQAKFDGVDVPEEYLQQLCPEALDEWAKEHLL